jgi:hypothetical protein
MVRKAKPQPKNKHYRRRFMYLIKIPEPLDMGSNNGKLSMLNYFEQWLSAHPDVRASFANTSLFLRLCGELSVLKPSQEWKVKDAEHEFIEKMAKTVNPPQNLAMTFLKMLAVITGAEKVPDPPVEKPAEKAEKPSS